MKETNLLNQKPMNLKIYVGRALLMLGSIVFLWSCGQPGKNSSGYDETLDSVYVDSVDTSIDDVVSETMEKQWDYSTETDEMNDSKSRFASLVSDNVIEFDFPYNGGSTMRLTVRYMKKYGTDVILRISSGQFLCSEYNGTNFVRVRFDDGTAMKYRTLEPADGSSDQLFLTNAKKFISLAKKAKVIKIEAPFYQEGNRVFTFSVDKPLEW